MLRLKFVLLLLILSASKCVSEISPEFSRLDGNWKLYKIVNGFRAPNTPADQEPKNIEILEIDAQEKYLVRKIDGLIKEKTKIDIRNIPDGSPNGRLSLVFVESDTYSFLEIDELKGELSLYQKCPIGAVLADGNTYVYKKM
jgi:hypothetical protein